MSFDLPWAFLLLPLLILIVFIHYFLRRPRTITISSLFFWDRILPPKKRVFWQILRNIVLILQLLAAFLLITSLAKPGILRRQSGIQGELVMIIDASASMLTREQEYNRFYLAKKEAEKIIRRIGKKSQAAIISAGPKPEALTAFTDNRSLLLKKLKSLECSEGEGDLSAALQMARQLGAERIIVITDAAWEAAPKEWENVEMIKVGSSQENSAITQFAFRDTKQGFRLGIIQVEHFGSTATATRLDIWLENSLIRSFPIQLGANSAQTVEIKYQDSATGRVRAELATEDALAVDNSAFAVFETHPLINILLVTPGNFFLESLVNIYPHSTAAITPVYVDSDWDLVIFDSTEVPALPFSHGLFINTIPQELPIQETGQPTAAVVQSWDSGHPILQGSVLTHIQIMESMRVRLGSGFVPLINGSFGPLLSLFEDKRRRFLLFSFNILTSNFPLTPAFPMIMDNSIQWLSGKEKPFTGYRVGDPIPMGAGEIIPPKNRGTLADNLFYTEISGFYRLITADGDTRYVAVNLTSRQESDIRAKFEPQQRDITANGDQTIQVQKQYIYTILILLTLAFLILEWWLWGSA